ncbi:DDE superfamily endonuclease [Phytophthora infestans]|uniref:DDE superfamily endonuclease n=1 Tax=Phytophthora infestans TaxID=4787 RepID=A0A833SLM8_PHYIN|nr:DDE superfamily endonuclease [Phytophthora infestans]
MVSSETALLQWYIAKNKYMSRKKKLRFMLLLDQVERPSIPAVTFDFASYTDANSELEFRFDVAGVYELRSLLRISDTVVTAHGDTCSGDTALCVMLARLAFPTRYYDMMKTVERGTAWLCRVLLHMIDYVHDTFADKLFMAESIVSARMEEYCKAVEAKGAPTEGVFGFPDGTKVAVCRPSPRRHGERGENLQKHLYSGHKRIHCLNYQAVTAPDGLYTFEGKFLYGDPAYGARKYIVSGYKGNSVSADESDVNSEMSRLRESVEWNFKCMKTLWSYVDYNKQQKVRLSPVGKFVKAAMLLTNCHNCYYGGNQISQYFDLPPPSLQDYLGYCARSSTTFNTQDTIAHSNPCIFAHVTDLSNNSIERRSTTRLEQS